MAELVIWPAGQSDWFSCSPDQITWLDRTTLSAGRDPTLHRSPRCPGLRHVHYRWELFSRDTTHAVYLAQYTDGSPGHFKEVQAQAVSTLPPALPRFETHPVELTEGAWVVSVGKWILPLRISTTEDDPQRPEEPAGTVLGPTKENTVGAAQMPGSASPALPDAVSKVDAYFKRNGLARMALAYYYRDYILGTVAPRTTAMIDVAIALDLSAEGAVGEFKKELQRRIWNEQHHQRELAQFLLANGLIGRPDLDRALRVAAANEASGRTKVARDRLNYRHKR
ncbi:MAG TPA: hypothetical protein VFJ07_06750 [Streptosporangiaceae bacterium]|nr:hypothetical protein [Streptosporangiaceae bacterium]